MESTLLITKHLMEGSVLLLDADYNIIFSQHAFSLKIINNFFLICQIKKNVDLKMSIQILTKKPFEFFERLLGIFHTSVFILNLLRKTFTHQSDIVNSLYYMQSVGKWFIGPTIGSFSRGMEGIPTKMLGNHTAKDVFNATWFELNGSKMESSESVQITCLDHINCPCQNLDISGLNHNQYRSQGRYVATNVTYGGRNCFDNDVSLISNNSSITRFCEKSKINKQNKQTNF